MNGAAWASFQSAAEVPDRDDDYDERPVVTCADCGSLLGSYPAGVYADCEECGGFTLSQWVPEPEEPSDEDIAARETAWAEASLREHLDAERTRADAAEAECARLRANEEDINDVVTASCGWARHAREMEAERDGARAEADALRAIVEGRTVAPTPADVAAHALAHPIDDTGPASNGARRDATTGLWLCAVDGEGIVVMALAVETDDQGPYLMAWSSDYGWCGTGDIRRAWPLDATGRPCPWPVAP